MKSHRVKNQKRCPYPIKPLSSPATDDGSHLWAAIIAIPKKKVKK
jgi:hypothetical protein